MNDKIDRLMDMMGITEGKWGMTPCSNFSGTYVSYVGNNYGTLFQSRHADKKFSEDQCNADSLLISQSRENLKALITTAHFLEHEEIRFDLFLVVTAQITASTPDQYTWEWMTETLKDITEETT